MFGRLYGRLARGTASRLLRISSVHVSGPRFKLRRLVAGGVVVASALAQVGNSDSLGAWVVGSVAHACGIVGFVSEKESAVPYLLEGLNILQNRGYDSAGICTVQQDKRELRTTKFASVGSTSDSVEILQKKAPAIHGEDQVGIAHTRWATHGGKTDENAHPHSDYKNRIALVHNGTIENCDEIKHDLMSKGIPFKSETDTEVIAQLIGFYLDQDMGIVDAVKRALSRLEGTWGLAIVHKDSPGQMIAARNGSPLVVGVGNGRTFVASEVSAFSRHTQQFIALKDGEIAVLKADGVSLDMSRVEKAPHEDILLTPEPFPHWTIKEIMEQPVAVAKTLGYGGRLEANGDVKLGGLEDNKEVLLPIRHLLLSACGTSYFASLYGAQIMRSLRCFDTVSVEDASEVRPETFAQQQGGLLVVSQSGETKDTYRALVTAGQLGVPRVSVVNQVGSLIARTTNCGVYLNAGREHAVASTKAFTTQVTALALVAAWFAQNRDKKSGQVSQRREEVVAAIHRLPIYMGMTLRTHDKCKLIAEKLLHKEHLFVLGKGYAESIAKETALKIKEITYCHAEGYCGGALKHGPFALLEKGTPVLLIILDDEHQDLMRIAAAEVRARGAYNIVVTDNPKLAEGLADDVITIPSNGCLTALLAVVPMQLLAYEMAVRKGINPDKPRHLAKAVTVD